MLCIKKADPKGQDRTEASDIKSAQEFLPFEDIREDMILLGQHRYRAVLACTATNYHLKTAREKENIEMAFQRFLNSISFPITFFLQTKVIDNTDRLKSLKAEIEHTVSDFPNIANYAEQYLSDMASLNEKLGNEKFTALITTLYGCILAHVVFGPVAQLLRNRDSEEVLCKEIIVEGVMAILAGENPKSLKERLLTYMAQKQREMGDE